MQVQAALYLTGEEPELLDHFPELGMLRDIVFYLRLAVSPDAEHLPKLARFACTRNRLHTFMAQRTIVIVVVVVLIVVVGFNHDATATEIFHRRHKPAVRDCESGDQMACARRSSAVEGEDFWSIGSQGRVVRSAIRSERGALECKRLPRRRTQSHQAIQERFQQQAIWRPVWILFVVRSQTPCSP